MENNKFVGVNIEVPAGIHQETKISAIKLKMNLKDYIIYCLEQMNGRNKE